MESERTSQRSNDLVVYTTIMGGNYTLPPVPESSEVQYICFTDRQYFQANGWAIREVNPILPNDLPRSSREPKICPHRYLAEFERSIYIDPSVELLQEPMKIWDSLVAESVVVSAFYHSFRDSLLDEFIAVLDQQLDNSATIAEQFNSYSSLGTSALNQKPVWGGFLLRRHNDKNCIEAMETWFAHVLRYSRRDQLSLPIVLESVPHLRRQIVHLENHESEFHCWPRNGYARPKEYEKSSKPVLFSNSFDIRRLELFKQSLEGEVNRLENAMSLLNKENDEKTLKIDLLIEEIATAYRSRYALDQTFDQLSMRIARKNQRIENLTSQLDSVLSSRSYKLAMYISALRKVFVWKRKHNESTH